MTATLQFAEPPNPQTVRDKIIWTLANKLAALPGDLPGGDLFQFVMMNETYSVPGESYPVIAIIEAEEATISMLYPYVDKALKIILEFRWLAKDGVDTNRQFRYYLAQLQKSLFGTQSNIQLMSIEYPAGLSTNVHEEGNAPQIDPDPDSIPSGILQIVVSYRHVNGDPYSLD